ncbi:MAG: VWA domain-containing protein [Vicinamibacterales bacterium]
MHTIRLLSAVLALALVAAPRPAAQQVFRAGSQTVPIYATVVDRSGRLVPDLVQDEFEVYDDGKRQDLSIFKSDVQPITVVVMLDTSGSMTSNIDLLKVAAEQFVLRLLPDDKAKIGSFSDLIYISDAFTNDRDALIGYLREEIRFGNPTHLWDAIDRSMTEMRDESGRRVVLIFTDGEDSFSTRVNYDDVMTRARNEEFMIYAIGLQSRIMGQVTRPDRRLRRLAEETGGGYFELRETADLNSTFTRVADELHRQYVLGFSPTALDGKLHKLEVKVKRPGMTVRARKSYLAEPSAPGFAALAPRPAVPRPPRR